MASNWNLVSGRAERTDPPGGPGAPRTDDNEDVRPPSDEHLEDLAEYEQLVAYLEHSLTTASDMNGMGLHRRGNYYRV
jgi:hypothetical protein